MPKRLRSLRCPICKTPTPRTAPEFPFCSVRCRSFDLGRWASGQYVVSSPLAEPEAATLDEASPNQDDDTD